MLLSLLLWIVQAMYGHTLAANTGAASVAALPQGQPFTRKQAYAFLDAAQRAEAIKDPLKRCMAYPDPPGSHWDHDAVVAYCHYHNQLGVTLADARRLIRAGRAAELDRQFARALHAQLTEPGAHGRFDYAMYQDFDKPTLGIRSLIETWKRESPDSAYAYTASGIAYVQAAFTARGTDYLDKTPKSNIEAMNRLAALADKDLQRAIKLNPKVTAAYDAMVNLGGVETEPDDYGLKAVRNGLAIQPDDFGIFETFMWLEQPNWDGSFDDMAMVNRTAQQRAKTNPLLKLLMPREAFYRIDHCHCAEKVELPAYIGALAHLGDIDELSDAAYTAKDVGDKSTMAIYLSEELRFDPDKDNARIDRMYALVDFDYLDWAIRDGDGLIAKSPRNEYAIKARGWAYLIKNDLPDAERDFQTAYALNPSDQWARSQLIGTYFSLKHWNKAWSMADRMIRQSPHKLDGWVLRADIQRLEPRPGLRKTIGVLATHFPKYDKNPKFQAYLDHLKAVAQKQGKPHQNSKDVISLKVNS